MQTHQMTNPFSRSHPLNVINSFFEWYLGMNADMMITARKQSCGKVIFSQVSVCPQEGVGNIKCIMA